MSDLVSDLVSDLMSSTMEESWRSGGGAVDEMKVRVRVCRETWSVWMDETKLWIDRLNETLYRIH